MEKKNRKSARLEGPSTGGGGGVTLAVENDTKSSSRKRGGGSFAERFSIGRFFYSSRLMPHKSKRSSQKNRSPLGPNGSFSDLEKGIPVIEKSTDPSSPQSGGHHSFSSSKTDRTSSISDASSTECKDFMDCPLCLTELPPEWFPKLSSCSHRSCFSCMQQYLRLEISESRVNVTCPECTEAMHPSDICRIVDDPMLFEKYGEFMLRRILAVDPDTRWCPAPDCGYAVIASGCASCPKLKCERPGCGSYFCYHCKAAWHPNQTCDSARAERSATFNPTHAFSHDTQTREDIKRCPICRVLIVKMDDGSCNHMTCAVCGAEFCWLCMNVVGDLHYLSPSGCTFWGKKPWSRKKKILWQLGILVGAPVGIALIAGIAIPAIIIGVPIWTGRKMYTRYQYDKKCKRNSAMVGGVLTAVVVGPVLATLAVCIGVPILLFYVYGVVPVSLCRSSGCGVTASASGVRLDFDESAEYGVGVQSMADKSTATADGDLTGHKEGNPSIGEVSLSLESGVQIDQDGESASTAALAGSIIAQRLDVSETLADSNQNTVVTHSETASQKSDTATSSTRALHGSLLNYKSDTVSTCSYKMTSGGGNSNNDVEQSNDQPNLSLSSLEELTASLVQRVRSLKQDGNSGVDNVSPKKSENTGGSTTVEAQSAKTSRSILRSLFFNMPSTSSSSATSMSEDPTISNTKNITTGSTFSSYFESGKKKKHEKVRCPDV